MIVTEQEGAEIWINGKDTGLLTPKAIEVPRNTEVDLTLKLTAHFNHAVTIRTGHHLSYYHTKLERVPLRLISNDTFDELSF